MAKQSLPKRFRHIRAHWFGLVVFAFWQGLLAIVYGEGGAVGFFSGTCVLALAAAYTPRVSAHRQATSMLLCSLLGFVWGAYFFLPLGPAPWVLQIAFALSAFSLLRSHVSAAFSSAFVAAVPLALVSSGYAPVVATAIPAAGSTLLTLATIAAFTLSELRRSRRHLDRALRKVAALRRELVAEHACLLERERCLSEASAANRAELDALTAQLLREADLMDDLRLREEDQRAAVAAIHQDLREPLRSIVSFTQLAKRRLGRYPRSETLADYLSFAEDGGRRMAAMLTDLSAYATDAHGADAVGVVDLDGVFAEVQLNVHDAVERRGARLTAEALPSVVGQRTPLVQLFQNLVSNALKFSRPGVAPSVHLCVYRRDDGLLGIRVTDNGIGIPPNQIDKVFGLFNRAHGGDGYEGTGVGLALCRKIAIAHGGDISVTSVPGEGTTFSIGLRAAAVELVATAPAPVATAAIVGELAAHSPTVGSLVEHV